MKDPNEPSPFDCGAPWNEGDDGECDCARCRHRRKIERKNKYLETYGPDESYLKGES